MLALLFVVQTTVGAIKGTVIDTTQHAVRGVIVELVGSTTSAVTDTAGHFRLSGVAVGQQIIHVGHVASQLDVKADTAVEAVLMVRNVPPPHLVWLGCKPFGTCKELRYVASFRHHNIPPGVGVIRDSTTWTAFLTRHAMAQGAEILNDIVDWRHEMLVIVCDAGINRVERHNDQLTVLLGPDSISGTRPAHGAPLATVIAVKRTTQPVEYRAILPMISVPATADWSTQ